jgi:hypothetical protein
MLVGLSCGGRRDRPSNAPEAASFNLIAMRRIIAFPGNARA